MQFLSALEDRGGTHSRRCEKLRREEPASPLAITELQGGWFSEFGGLLSVKQDGVDAAQINMLTKTALELGVTSFNYYMGFGGTNFDWAAKKLTTTYDYAAPIREPGGLWDKYYAVRGIGQSLRAFGSVLTRAVALARRAMHKCQRQCDVSAPTAPARYCLSAKTPTLRSVSR